MSNLEDRGGLVFNVQIVDNELIIDFGKEVKWVGLSKNEVKRLMKILKDKLKLMKDTPIPNMRFNLN